MKTYALSGGATGIGAAIAEKLRAAGHLAIVIDVKPAQGAVDIIADLSTAQGRLTAIDGVKARCGEGLDGFVACAGLGPHIKLWPLIDQVNFFGATRCIEGLRPLIAERNGAVVALSSNSAALPGLNDAHVQALLADDEGEACRLVEGLDGHNAYAGSKHALARWVRRNAPDYMREGINLNALAPGVTRTPLTDAVLDDPELGQAIRAFSNSIPYGEPASPEMIADAALFLLSSHARFICGSVLFVDGGHDALLRPDQF